MHAWTKSGNPIEHPKPWGVYGAFSTLRITSESKILFQKDHFERIYNTAQYLELPWVPQPDELNSRIQDTLPQPSADHEHLLRICIFEDILGLSYRPSRTAIRWKVGYLPTADLTQALNAPPKKISTAPCMNWN